MSKILLTVIISFSSILLQAHTWNLYSLRAAKVDSNNEIHWCDKEYFKGYFEINNGTAKFVDLANKIVDKFDIRDFKTNEDIDDPVLTLYCKDCRGNDCIILMTRLVVSLVYETGILEFEYEK